jgi:transposase
MRTIRRHPDLPRSGCWRPGKPTLTPEFENFRGSLGIGVHLCKPRDPEARGVTERNNGTSEHTAA